MEGFTFSDTPAVRPEAGPRALGLVRSPQVRNRLQRGAPFFKSKFTKHARIEPAFQGVCRQPLQTVVKNLTPD